MPEREAKRHGQQACKPRLWATGEAMQGIWLWVECDFILLVKQSHRTNPCKQG
jgi:hypothetical protein